MMTVYFYLSIQADSEVFVKMQGITREDMLVCPMGLILSNCQMMPAACPNQKPGIQNGRTPAILAKAPITFLLICVQLH